MKRTCIVLFNNFLIIKDIEEGLNNHKERMVYTW